MSEEQRQSSKLLKPESFDVCKNTVALIIVMLDHLKLDIEVSNRDMKTMKSSNYREMLKNDGNTNGVLAAT